MTLEIMDHSERPARAPDTPVIPLTPGPTPSDPTNPTPLSLMDNYKTPDGKRVRRDALRTIYALVQYRDAQKLFHAGEMQKVIRTWMIDEKLDVQALLLKFQEPEDGLTTAVRDSFRERPMEEDVQVLWEHLKPM